MIRVLLLSRFNRFRHMASFDDQDEHIRFRREVMGSSLTEFRDKIVERGGAMELANTAARILLQIQEKEPYLRNGFWEVYFHDFDWRLPSAS